ncbi:hypothetical protein DACRYDRAFT_106548 [Dacryopinax primogenitus]|uniref:Uncharacterized protein n=1 Tax=Dacryopinax primogenitus (strain DJM 731) TaxID=1858805 RepID=M5G3Y7_DACPD|nr:uncharacterized protein DACRYDRAFT_106548 [Dacryopinax primogenitus]EJU03389.1 hypothetical protein DACRYDRAFT_106548 [Dacryopinax primogenitus]
MSLLQKESGIISIEEEFMEAPQIANDNNPIPVDANIVILFSPTPKSTTTIKDLPTPVGDMIHQGCSLLTTEWLKVADLQHHLNAPVPSPDEAMQQILARMAVMEAEQTSLKDEFKKQQLHTMHVVAEDKQLLVINKELHAEGEQYTDKIMELGNIINKLQQEVQKKSQICNVIWKLEENIACKEVQIQNLEAYTYDHAQLNNSVQMHPLYHQSAEWSTLTRAELSYLWDLGPGKTFCLAGNISVHEFSIEQLYKTVDEIPVTYQAMAMQKLIMTFAPKASPAV